MENPKLISIIVPIYNEEKNISSLHARLMKVFDAIKNNFDYEIIFIDDGSLDGSGKITKDLSNSNLKVKYIEFSRNFGKEIATSAGIHHAKGDAAIMIDADLQHPPETIPELIKKWQSGAEVVIGLRRENRRNGFARKIGAYLFYKIINLIGDTKVMPNATDFCLIDRKVIDEFNHFTERNRITRGLIAWIGFRRDYVNFDVDFRNSGKARYNIFKLTKLALNTFVSYSFFPLKFAGYLGILITLFSGIFGSFILVDRYLLDDPWGLSFSGPAILAIIILFLIGIVLICLGLMALYIANIHGEVINRPMYVIRERKL